MVDKNYVLWWDLWFAVMQTVVYSSVVVLGIIVLRVGAVYHDSLILSCTHSGNFAICSRQLATDKSK